MKLRIRGNSVRLRLLRGEVRELGAYGRVSETIHFGLSPEQILTYSLETASSVDEITAQFSDNQIKILLPVNIARNWVESEQISLSGAKILDSANTLQILIEKDFVCLDRDGDPDNLDAYPHPH